MSLKSWYVVSVLCVYKVIVCLHFYNPLCKQIQLDMYIILVEGIEKILYSSSYFGGCVFEQIVDLHFV